jgi:hypothetical protein
MLLRVPQKITKQNVQDGRPAQIKTGQLRRRFPIKGVCRKGIFLFMMMKVASHETYAQAHCRLRTEYDYEYVFS